MHGVADKYDMPGLKEKAAGKFDAAIWEMEERERGNEDAGPGLVDEMMEAIPSVYGSTPEGERCLRDRAVAVVRGRWGEVRGHKGLRDLVEVVPGFFEEPGIKGLGVGEGMAGVQGLR